MPKYTLQINGTSHTVESEPDTPLLYVLRDELELAGPKFGCGLSQCGACMVLIDGSATPSCVLPVSSSEDTEITTLEGLAKSPSQLHPVQQAFVDEQAAQCGYCLNGMVMATVGLLNVTPNPSLDEIKNGLERNLCRCSAHSRIIKAVQKASKNL
ncbi:(2Fe-2S)-binding protein [Algoriphagus halophytocola]|uniref:(2Fe-2S)-binding protein n=1 Tax=Algoriphagus halophytocola TaxID=2991499 RepID=UPI0022DDE125|nr:(2Fe-2S)-binding protein [Algoriphagus sp. TR-M9]WBL44583.1 (2Fe-2S)-binding protein [Algoriphagus sp. TR-M9]